MLKHRVECKDLGPLHGGRIWVESEGVGRGSTFCFTLPRVTQATPPAPPYGTPA